MTNASSQPGSRQQHSRSIVWFSNQVATRLSLSLSLSPKYLADESLPNESDFDFDFVVRVHTISHWANVANEPGWQQV